MVWSGIGLEKFCCVSEHLFLLSLGLWKIEEKKKKKKGVWENRTHVYLIQLERVCHVHDRDSSTHEIRQFIYERRSRLVSKSSVRIKVIQVK